MFLCTLPPQMSVKSLKDEILNRKRKLEEIGLFKQQKYVKRSELEQERLKQYLEEQKKIEEKRKKVFIFFRKFILFLLLNKFWLNQKAEAKLNEQNTTSPTKSQSTNEVF
jgi:hypothetical protein